MATTASNLSKWLKPVNKPREQDALTVTADAGYSNGKQF
jgi:hypothetical protein